MSASRSVGRVGGLAAMLGVGAALSMGQGVAWADDDPAPHDRPAAASPERSSPSRPPGPQRPVAGSRLAGRTLPAHTAPPDPIPSRTGGTSRRDVTPGSAGATTVPTSAKSRQRSTRIVSPAPPSGALQQSNGHESTRFAGLGSGGRSISPALNPLSTALPASSVAPTALAATAPTAKASVTLKTVVADALAWIGVGRPAPSAPTPVRPANSVIESLWLAGRSPLFKPGGIYRVGRSFSLDGVITGQVLTPDGTRAVITTDATDWEGAGSLSQTAVVDTATGRQVGPTQILPGVPNGQPLVTADGRHVVLTARAVYNGAVVMVIDTATGQQVGATFTIPEGMPLRTVLSTDRTRAVVATTSSDLISGGTRVAVIDAATGAQIGTTVTLPGDNSTMSNVDRTHAVVATIDGDWNTGFTTRITVIDTSTGSQTGSPVTVSGQLTGNAISGGISTAQLPGADGSRAVFVTSDYVGDSAVTRLAVIDTATSTLVGAVELAGSPEWTPLVLTADGRRAVVTATGGSPGATQTQVAVVDTATGQQVGTTATFTDSAFGVVAGEHAIITMSNHVAVMDTAAGTATTITLPEGSVRAPLVSADGVHALISDTAGAAVIVNTATGEQRALSGLLTGTPKAFDTTAAGGTRAVLTTTEPGAFDGMGTTRVVLIDTTTGAQVGQTLTVKGDAGYLIPVTADGKHALINTFVFTPIRRNAVGGFPFGFASNRVTVIDTDTGGQTGTALTVTGAETLTRSGDRVLISRFTGFNTQMAVIDMNTGRKALQTVAAPGEYGGEPLVTPDGTRVVIPTYHRGRVGRSTISVAALAAR